MTVFTHAPRSLTKSLLCGVALATAGVLAGSAASGPAPPGAAAPSGAPQDVQMIISGAGGRQPRLGLPDFVLSSAEADLKAAATTIAEVLFKDLEFEEEFYMIDRKVTAPIEITDRIDALPVEKWAAAGADYVVLGTARRTAAELTVALRVVAVREGDARKQVHERQYNCRVAEPRACAHFMADALHLTLRGVRGVAQSRLAFVSNRDGDRPDSVFPRGAPSVYISDYDGAGQQRVTANRMLNIMPRLSPDGQWLAYVSYQPNADIFLQPIYQAATRLRRPAGGTEHIANRDPAFSPDGRRIAFSSRREGNNLDIYVVDREGATPPVRLTNSPGDDLTPTWSPDASQIAFVSDRSSPDIPMLYVMSSDGLGGARLLNNQRADRPSWSPAGNLIAFTCGSSGGYDICVYDFDRNDVRKVTDGTGTNEQPVFAPNGRHILFSTTRWGKKQLAVISIKGTGLRRLTEVGDNNYPAWSPAR